MSKKCTPLWREAHFKVKMYEAPQCRTTFGSCDVEKVHAVVARSTCRSQNVKTPGVRTILDVQVSKKCTQFWGEAHFEVKMLKKTRGSDHFLEVQMTTLHYITLHSTTLHYITLHSTTLQLQLHNYTPLHSTTLKLHHTTLHYTTLHSTTLHYITLHYLPLHFTTLHYTTLHYTTTTTTQLHLHYTTLH